MTAPSDCPHGEPLYECRICFRAEEEPMASRSAAPDCWSEGQSHDFVGGKCLRCGKDERDDQLERGVEYLRRKFAPESETLRCDAVQQDMEQSTNPIEYRHHQYLDLARQLERELNLAQTEIKGHMRVGDDLQVRIAELEKDAARLDAIQTEKLKVSMSRGGDFFVHADLSGDDAIRCPEVRAAIDAAKKQ
jgi:hypothetical protein